MCTSKSSYTDPPTYPPNFVLLALTGAEIAGGGADSAPPSPPGRVILRPSPGSVLKTCMKTFDVQLRVVIDLTHIMAS